LFLYRSGPCTSVDLCIDGEGGSTPVVIRFIERGPALDVAAVRRQMAFHRRAAGHPHIVQLLVRPPPAGVLSAPCLPAADSSLEPRGGYAFKCALLGLGNKPYHSG
jgi:hypothetical protein